MGEKGMVFIFGRESTRPRGSSMTDVTPSSELWLGYCEQTNENQVMRMPSRQRGNEQIIMIIYCTWFSAKGRGIEP